MRTRILSALIPLALILGCHATAPAASAPAKRARPARPPRPVDTALKEYVEQNYTKSIQRIAMRDGVHLFTIVYSPKDTSKTYPILLFRTPYSIGPYGENEMRDSLGSGDGEMAREGFIFVYQDVRGKFMSEGEFENMRPHIDHKSTPQQIDEASDTWDTIDWLVKNVPNNNGRVGQWGISYPGFYSSAGMIDAHPALKAVSPQAPIADWFFDDFFHHGAFFLPHCFNFFASFGKPRPAPTADWSPGLDHGTQDGYQFFLDLGSLRNANDRYYHNEIAFWNTLTQHPNYDEFWQARNLLPHLKHVAPAVMVVGGWYDAEDLYGALNTYQAIEQQNPGVMNMLVMGPWRHGGWSRSTGESLGNIHFDSNTSEFYRQNIELPFFVHYLKDGADPKLPEAYVFQTGRNEWRTFDHWPPHGLKERNLYFHAAGKLSWDEPRGGEVAYDEYVSDPAKPVPFTEVTAIGMTAEYMTDDQRFAARRPDVLAYQTVVLNEDVTLAGPSLADLWVSTTGTDSDWVVKLIDVWPAGAADFPGMSEGKHLGGYQEMVRSEVIRGRFRESNSKPKPFTPNEATKVDLPLQDVLHTFRAGHRIMIQVQSTWFPLVDRNPQKFVPNIFEAQESDFIRATQRVYHDGKHATCLKVGVMKD